MALWASEVQRTLILRRREGVGSLFSRARVPSKGGEVVAAPLRRNNVLPAPALLRCRWGAGGGLVRCFWVSGASGLYKSHPLARIPSSGGFW